MIVEGNSWCLVESDPVVFMDLMKNYGIENAQAVEVFSLDEATLSAQFTEMITEDKLAQMYGDDYVKKESLRMCDNVMRTYGFIFLYRYDTEAQKKFSSSVDTNPDKDLIFSQQIVKNSCATHAILSLAFNSKAMTIGSKLSEMKNSLSPLSYEARGHAIGRYGFLSDHHNEYRSKGFVQELQMYHASKNQYAGDSFHYLCYVPVNNKLYELDGLKTGPVLVGEIPSNGNWISICQKRILEIVHALDNVPSANSKGGSEIRFSLIAITENKMEMYKKFHYYNSIIFQRTAAKLLSYGEDIDIDDIAEVDDAQAPSFLKDIEELSDDISLLKTSMHMSRENRNRFQSLLIDEKQIETRNREDVLYMKHDFSPFAATCLRLMAKKGILSSQINALNESALQVKNRTKTQ